MKFNLLLALGLLFSARVFAQNQDSPSFFSSGIEGCYSDYYITFHDRGALPVTDGEYEAVMIVINQGKSQCYMAKAIVKDGKITAPVSIQKEDGTYVSVSRIFKALDQTWLEGQDLNALYAITDGMSNIFKTQDGHFLRMFFHTFLQPEHGGNKLAPPASDLIKSGK